MPYEIRKTFTFEASHFIAGLPDHHKCGRLHGHSYTVEVILQSEALNEIGFVRDYGELDDLAHYVKHYVDHRHLNDVLGHDQTTAENIARFLFTRFASRWPELVCIRVSETAKTWASWSPDGRGI